MSVQLKLIVVVWSDIDLWQQLELASELESDLWDTGL